MRKKWNVSCWLHEGCVISGRECALHGIEKGQSQSLGSERSTRNRTRARDSRLRRPSRRIDPAIGESALEEEQKKVSQQTSSNRPWRLERCRSQRLRRAGAFCACGDGGA